MQTIILVSRRSQQPLASRGSRTLFPECTVTLIAKSHLVTQMPGKEIPMIGLAEKGDDIQSPPVKEVKNEGTNHQIISKTVPRPSRYSPFPRQSGCVRADFIGGEILHLLKSTAHDLRGALVSVGAGLKLVGKGYYGRMDQGAANEIETLRSDVASLMGMLEDFLGRAFSLSEGVVHGSEELNLRTDVLDRVLAEIANEMNRRKAAFQNGLESIPSEVHLAGG